MAFLVAGALALSACGDDATADDAADSTSSTAVAAEAADEAMEDAAEAGTIVDVAAGAGQFTTLLAAAEAADLVGALNADGPLTVFAPTDDAFATALDALGLTAEELLGDTETLTSILTYHVVDGKVLSTDLSDGMTAPTLNGADITVDLSDGVKINDATVTTADVAASNGVIHIIDTVLLPPAG
jgi:uncharacterized surface protein with fasciclin (FAS1) repeats